MFMHIRVLLGAQLAGKIKKAPQHTLKAEGEGAR
jgi:hypothetical protein